jgi:hypothetical protein
MSWKSTWVLLTLAAALLAFSIFVEHPLREARARQASRFVLPALDPATVTNLSLTLLGQHTIEVQRSAPGAHDWRLTQPVAYPGNAEKIEALVHALSELEWQDRIGASDLAKRPDASEAYGLARPQISLQLESSKASRSLDIGNITALGDQMFLRVAGAYDVYKIGVALTNVIPLNKDFWRDTAVVDLPAIKFNAIHARSIERAFDLTRDPLTGLWQMTKPVAARADTPKIDQLLKTFGQMQAIAFINDESPNALEQCGLQTPLQTPQLEFSMLQDTNILFSLQLGTNYARIPGAAFARRRDPSNIVLVPTAALLPWEADSTNFLDRHMFSLPASNVDAIDVRGDDSFVVRRAGESGWEVAAGDRKFPADGFFMSEWMGGLTNVDLEIEKMVVDDVAPYGLARPRLVYKLLGAGGGSNQLLAQIEFGSNSPAGVFERRVDESSVNVIPADEFGRLPHVSWQLRDRSIWNFSDSNVVSVAIHYLGGDRKYLRDPSGQWTFAPGYHGPPFPDWARLEEGLHRLGQLRAVYWDGVGDDPADRFGIRAADHRVTLEVRNGGQLETREIAFGKRSPYLHPYAAVTKDGEQLIFEFPVDLFDGFIVPEFTLPAALRPVP